MASGIGGGGARVPLAQINADLTETHRRCLRKLFETPYHSATEEIGEISNGVEYMPTIQNIIYLNIPADAFPQNPSTWGDLLATDVGTYPHLRTALLMLSAIISDPEVGTRSGGIVDPNAAELDGLGERPDAQAGAGRGRGQDQRGGRGRGRGRPRGGGAMGRGASFEAATDNRGAVDTPTGLMFEMGDRRYPKAIPTIEDVKNADGRTVMRRVAIFIFDPKFNLNEAVGKLIERNATLYGASSRVPENPYLEFTRIRSEQDYIDKIALPYLMEGIEGGYVPGTMKLFINKQIDTLRDPSQLIQLGHSITNPNHPACPSNIFNKKMAFALYMTSVEDTQRDPSAYFALNDVEMRDGRAVVAALGDAMDVEDANLPGFVVDSDAEDDGEQASRENLEHPTLRGFADDHLMSDDDGEESEELLELMRQRVARSMVVPLSDGSVLGDDADITPEELMERTRAELNIQTRIDQNVARLRMAKDETFLMFPIPENVYRIRSERFGRHLLNVPLLERISTLGSRGASASFVDPTHNTLTIQDLNEIADGEASQIDDEMHHRFSEGPSETLRRERFQALKHEMDRLDVVDRFEITDMNINDLNEFRACFREIRLRIMVARQKRHEQQCAADVDRWLSDAAGVNFRSPTNGDTMSARLYGSFLPETINQRLSQSEFMTFAAKNVLLQLRAKNLAELARLRAQKYETEEKREEAMMEFRIKATDVFWDAICNSELLPTGVRTAVNWFRRLSPSEQWGEHLDLLQDVSSFGNMIVLMLSRYNEVFRGASNQEAFMLATFCHYDTFHYDWGIKLNLLLMGAGSAGKSYVFEVVETLTCPGTFSSWSHTTDKAYSTGTQFADETFCMPEAPLGYVAVDKYGRSTVSDPVLKDRLARQRSSTRGYHKNEEGERITKDELVMVMGCILMATNDTVPPDDSPLMQRFIVRVVNDVKRPDFNIGDNSIPLKDIISTHDNARAVRTAQLFAFQMLIFNKMIMAGILPEMSGDAHELLLKEILSNYSRITRVSTTHPRKRKEIVDMATTVAQAYVVSQTTFTHISEPYVRMTRDERNDLGVLDGEDSTFSVKPFHPVIYVKEGLPRMFVTDEHVIYAVTLLKFLFDNSDSIRILDMIGNGTVPITSGEPFELKHARFRVLANPYAPDASGMMMMLERSRRSRYRGYANGGGGGGGGVALEEHEEEAVGQRGVEIPSHVIDPRYAILVDENRMQLYTKISKMFTQSAPPTNQVYRVIESFKSVRCKAHPARLKLVGHSESAPDMLHHQRQQSHLHHHSRMALDPASESSNDVRPSLSLSRNAQIEAMSRDAMALGLDESTRLAAPSTTVIPMNQPLVVGETLPTINHDTSYIGLQHQALQSHGIFTWELDMEGETTDEPVLQIYLDPTDRRGKRVVVAVLLEYIKNENHGDALLESIRRVMSNNTLPPEGRRFITALPVTYAGSDDDPERYETPEVMPQFCHMLKIERSEKPAMLRWVQPGTQDSRAFISSSLRFGTESDTSSITAQLYRSKQGVQFQENQAMNTYFAWRHFMRNGLVIYETKYHRAAVDYTPEVETAVARTVIDKAAGKSGSNITLIEHYPESCIQELLRTRLLTEMDTSLHPELAKELYIGTSDLLTQVGDIEATRLVDRKAVASETIAKEMKYTNDQVKTRAKSCIQSMAKATGSQMVVGTLGAMQTEFRQKISEHEKSRTDVYKRILELKKVEARESTAKRKRKSPLQLESSYLTPESSITPSTASPVEKGLHNPGKPSSMSRHDMVLSVLMGGQKRPPAHDTSEVEPPSKRPRTEANEHLARFFAGMKNNSAH